MAKRILLICLALLMLLPFAVACAEEPPAPPAPGPAPEETDELQEMQIITEGTCYVYYDRSSIKDIKVLTNAIAAQTGNAVEAVAVYQKSGGLSVPFFEDNAIYVGNVMLHDGSRSAGLLRANDCMVGIVDNRFIIGGISTKHTEDAVSYFVSMVLPSIDEGKNLTFHRDNNYRVNGKYSLGDFAINGLSLGHFKIHVDEKCTVSEWRTAVLLRQQISEKIGYDLEIVQDETCKSRGVIRIGSALCTATDVSDAHSYDVVIDGTTVEIEAESVFGYQEAQDFLLGELFYSTDKNNVKTLDASSGKSGNGKFQAEEPLEINGDVRIMFNNIHGQVENGTMPVEQPTKMLCELYLEYLPDVIGLQECTSHSFDAGIIKLLSSEYDMVWDYQTCTAMFYRRATVELLDSGYYCFDDLRAEFGEGHIYRDLIEENGYNTNDIYYSNINKNGDEGQKRLDASKGVTWGIFRLKSTGNIFLAGSTHLWWEGNEDLDDIVRMVQMRKLKNIASEAAAAFAEANGIEAGTMPIFLGGDYNSNASRPSLASMEDALNSYRYVNVNDVSTVKLLVSTHHAYATYDKELEIYVNLNKNNNSYRAALDHIFVNAESVEADMFKANYTGILDDDYAFLSSDHLAIYTDVTFNASAPKTN
ncbi:MAG: hypothetical protein IJY22_02585 [Clostridia bacterium]|nr:hypothetical protein [Clostridia bacterium]